MNIKISDGVTSSSSHLRRNSGGNRRLQTPNFNERSNRTRSEIDPKPLRRTPGAEDDAEIANLIPTPDHSTLPGEGLPWRDKRTINADLSIAGTEQSSIMDKITWRHAKGLYDMVKQQKDEASREACANNVNECSKFHGSDVLSDLSDNTSRDNNTLEDILHRGEAIKFGQSLATANTPSRKQIHQVPDCESELISGLWQASGNLSTSALESLVTIFSQTLQMRREIEASHCDTTPNFGCDDQGKFTDRKLSSSRNQSPSPKTHKTQSSPFLLSQSAPSSFFAGAIPAATNGCSQNTNSSLQNNNNNKRTNGTPTMMNESRRSKDSGKDRDMSSPRGSSSLQTPAGRRSFNLESFDEEDEEMLSLSNEEKGGSSSATATPALTNMSNNGTRGMTTPSPKQKRAITTTPTKTPPIRCGAIPPVALYLSRESDGSEFIIPLNNPNHIPNSNNGNGYQMVTNTTKNNGDKYRESKSPPNITRNNIRGSDLMVPRLRKVHRRDLNTAAVATATAAAAAGIKIVVPDHTSQSRKNSRQNTGSINTGHSDSRVTSAAKLSEWHMSPCSAFDDRSINSMSSSSASYYSNNYQ
jgi:hypothetical protein